MASAPLWLWSDCTTTSEAFSAPPLCAATAPADVDEPVRAVPVGGEPSLHLDVGNRDGAAPARDRNRPHAGPVAEDPGRRTAGVDRRRAEAVAAEVHGLALESAVGARVDEARTDPHAVVVAARPVPGDDHLAVVAAEAHGRERDPGSCASSSPRAGARRAALEQPRARERHDPRGPAVTQDAAAGRGQRQPDRAPARAGEAERPRAHERASGAPARGHAADAHVGTDLHGDRAAGPQQDAEGPRAEDREAPVLHDVRAHVRRRGAHAGPRLSLDRRRRSHDDERHGHTPATRHGRRTMANAGAGRRRSGAARAEAALAARGLGELGHLDESGASTRDDRRAGRSGRRPRTLKSSRGRC